MQIKAIFRDLNLFIQNEHNDCKNSENMEEFTIIQSQLLNSPISRINKTQESAFLSNFYAKPNLYVDKTLLIKSFFDSASKIIITRPRRWGKSLNVQMLKDFFSIETKEDDVASEVNSNRILFTGGQLKSICGEQIILRKLNIAKQEYQNFFNNNQGK